MGRLETRLCVSPLRLSWLPLLKDAVSVVLRWTCYLFTRTFRVSTGIWRLHWRELATVAGRSEAQPHPV